jgi:FMN phosphatase YigB (HAD superfamily)
MSRIRGILFDYGHTLVWFPRYEKSHLAAAKNVQWVLHSLGASIHVSGARTLIESYASRPNGTCASAEMESRGILVSAGVESFDQNDVQRVIDAEWRPWIQNARIRRGVKEILEYSRRLGLKLGVVANIWSGGMNPVLARLGIEKFFDAMVADMDVGFAKPDPRIFRIALDHLQLTPGETLMVGDNPRTDIKGAHKLGMRTARLMRGPNRTEPDEVEADFKINNFSALRPIIKKLMR